MEFYAKYIRDKRQLQPEYRSDVDEVNKLRDDVVYKWDVKQERNYEFHKKLFALLNLAHKNLNDEYLKLWANFEHFRAIVTMKAGYYEAIETEKGTIYLPLSISFGNMDETQFQEFYDKICNICCSLLDVNKPTIEKEILNFI